MRKSFSKINVPIALLCFYFFALIVLSVFSDDATKQTANLAAQIALPLILSLWVLTDAHQRGKQLCYDYDTFLFLAWPIMVPIYLFQTRGLRAFITLLCFVGICVLAILFGLTLAFVRELGS